MSSSASTRDVVANDAPAISHARAPSAARFALILALFFASGATGLIDQLCFSKYLSYVVGSTAHAVSAVLAAFMAGLAIGAHFAGKLSPRVHRPLLAYGVLELVVAGAVALSPLAFKALTPLYVAWASAAPNSVAMLSTVRWLLAMSFVVVPTVAMGATLPLLTSALLAVEGRDHESRERRLAALYAVNTLGGGSGALLAAYVVLPALGIAGTLLASALTSAAIGLIALYAGARIIVPDEANEGVKSLSAATDEASSASRTSPARRERLAWAALAFLSGALVFACEVVFTHLLALIIGNSAYAFGLILAAFLSCLFIGASQAARAHSRLSEAALPLGLAATAVALVLTLPLWDKLPAIFAVVGGSIQSFAGREAVRALIAFAILFVPTSLMGLTFPLLLQRAARFRSAPELVGRLTAVNTLGAVLGSLFTGYWVLPRLGSQNTLLAVALVFAASALFIPKGARGVGRRASVVLCASALLIALITPRWNPAQLTSGTNVYFDHDQKPENVLMMREDVHGGVTTVAERDSVITLYTNGKFQGNNGWEMHAQRFFAHYPALFVERFDRALVIGLGTGTTLGALTAYPWHAVDVVEISPSIVEAARRYFASLNRGALDDPRVVLHHADGRNHLLVTDARYDLISMELSSVWFAGAASLYSREYYELVSRHLSDRGIFQQWVQLHHIRRRDLATIMHTLRLVFPHVALFLGGGQGILVASSTPLRASAGRLAELEQRPTIRQTIPHERPLISLFDDILVEGAGLDRFLEQSAELSGEPLAALVSTDDNLYLEYATPRGNVLPWSDRDVLLADLRRFRDPAAIARLATY